MPDTRSRRRRDADGIVLVVWAFYMGMDFGPNLSDTQRGIVVWAVIAAICWQLYTIADAWITRREGTDDA